MDDVKKIDPKKLLAARAEWETVLGGSYVLVGAGDLDRYQECTIPQGNRALGILLPKTVEEIQKIVRVAARG